MKYNAGTYTHQYGHKSFSPSHLSSPFEWKSDLILDLLSQADRAVSELRAYSSLVPDVGFFIQMHKVKEATNSTRIEGTQTLIDEAVLSQKEIQPEKVNDWQEVQNYLKAIDFAIERMDELPLSIRLVKEIHTQLLDDVRGQEKMPGTIRTSQNWIGGANLNSAVFVPPHQLELATLLSDLEKFWHNEEWKVPPLIKIAISHYQFETIHPFLDGNGRTGRLLITLQLLHYGLLDTPTLYLSAFFEQHRGEYVDALLRTSISHDIDQWIRFFLTGIVESAIHSKTTFIAIDQLRVNYNARIENLGRRKKLALKLMNHLYSKPIVSSKDVQAFLEVTPATADRLIKAMEDESILVEKTGYARNRLFVLNEYLKLFK